MRLLQNKEVGGQLPYQECAAAPGRQKVSGMGAPHVGDGRCSTRSSGFGMPEPLFAGGAFFSGLAAAFQLRKKDGQEPQERQGKSRSCRRTRCLSGQPRYRERRRRCLAMPKAKPKNSPETIPTRPGSSSCANTMMAGNAEARMRPMMIVSTAVISRFA